MWRVDMVSVHSSCSRGGGRRVVVRQRPRLKSFPVVHEAGVGGRDKTNKRAARRRRGRQTDGIIEVEIDGVTVRVGGGADAKTVAAVIRALKATT
jgi:hypothetical protein